jgi:hypothetical protein
MGGDVAGLFSRAGHGGTEVVEDLGELDAEAGYAYHGRYRSGFSHDNAQRRQLCTGDFKISSYLSQSPWTGKKQSMLLSGGTSIIREAGS